MLMVLVRHGEKLLSPFDPDVTLTARGYEQAEQLAKSVKAGSLPRPHHIWSSPRKRAQATLSPLAHAFNLPLEINPHLDERQPGEDELQFRKRIELLLESLPEPVVYCCTHADWLYEAINLMPSDIIDTDMEAHFSYAQTRVFEKQNGLWRLSRSKNWKGHS